jgi:hypothetical protein
MPPDSVMREGSLGADIRRSIASLPETNTSLGVGAV